MRRAAIVTHPTTATNVFHRDGEVWTIAFDGKRFHLRDAKGLRYLAYLLRHPGQHIAAGALPKANVPPDTHSPEATASGGSDADRERARTAVTKRIKATINKITRHHPPLGHHLSATVKTGYTCAYLPDGVPLVLWEV